jgi:hypothetical protein
MTEEQYQEILAKVKSGEHIFNAVYPIGLNALWKYMQANSKPESEREILFPD